jgi:oxygen-dependent protoporphyrinogen oxidase
MKTATIIGAGFSGLVTAFYLTRAGWRVEIHEREQRAGGMLATRQTVHGPVETAANGLLNSARLEELSAAINVPLLTTLPASRKRYIWREKPRRWPLGLAETARLAGGVAWHARRLGPFPNETIAAWGRRVLGAGAAKFLLATGLSGIYAGDAERLSATLILRRTRAAQKPARRGTVAPAGGMQALVDGLTDYLEQRGAVFHYGSAFTPDGATPTVLCVNAPAAAQALAGVAPAVSQALSRIEMLPVVTATCFYPPGAARYEGFGCLFPRGYGWRALGVLFNTSIFAGRGAGVSETWILGGATDKDVISLSDDDLTTLLTDEHNRLHDRNDAPLAVHITRWPQALPHYTVELEQMLAALPPLPPKLVLCGNYLGGIGLTKIVERAATLLEEAGSRQ